MHCGQITIAFIVRFYIFFNWGLDSISKGCRHYLLGLALFDSFIVFNVSLSSALPSRSVRRGKKYQGERTKRAFREHENRISKSFHVIACINPILFGSYKFSAYSEQFFHASTSGFPEKPSSEFLLENKFENCSTFVDARCNSLIKEILNCANSVCLTCKGYSLSLFWLTVIHDSISSNNMNKMKNIKFHFKIQCARKSGSITIPSYVWQLIYFAKAVQGKASTCENVVTYSIVEIMDGNVSMRTEINTSG